MRERTRYILLAFVLFFTISPVLADLLPPTIPSPGYKIRGYYWDYMGEIGWRNGTGIGIFNGTVNPYNADVCTGTNASQRNLTNWTCVAVGGVETDPIATDWIERNNTYYNGSLFPNSTNFRNDTLQVSVNTKEPIITGSTQDKIWNGLKNWITQNTDNVTEGLTNLFFTESRFNQTFAKQNTTGLREGNNLYYTQVRFDTAFGSKWMMDGDGVRNNESDKLWNADYNQSRFSGMVKNDTVERIRTNVSVAPFNLTYNPVTGQFDYNRSDWNNRTVADNKATWDLAGTAVQNNNQSVLIGCGVNLSCSNSLVDINFTGNYNFTGNNNFSNISVNASFFVLNTTLNRVGIGTTQPTEEMELWGNSGFTVLKINSSAPGTDARLRLQRASVAKASYVEYLTTGLDSTWFFGQPTTGNGNGFTIGYWTGSVQKNIFFITNDTNNFGMGTQNPQNRLDVIGRVNATNFTGDGSTLTKVLNDSNITINRGVPQFIKIGDNVSTFSKTLVNATGLDFAYSPSMWYRFSNRILYASNKTAAGVAISVNGTTPASFIAYQVNSPSSLTMMNMTHGSEYNVGVNMTSVESINQTYMATIEGMVLTGTSAGNLTVTFNTSIGNSGLATVLAGSNVMYWQE